MSGEKTEEATEHKLQEARKKGQVSKSQDITSAALFLVGFFVVYASGGIITGELRQFIRLCFITATSREIDLGIIANLMYIGLQSLFTSILPLCGAAFVIAVVGNYAQVGFLLTFDPVKPQLKKLNPIEGIKGFFKLKKLIELLKSTIKLLIVALLAYTVVKAYIIPILLTVRMPLWETVGLVWRIVFDLSVRIGVVFGVIAAADWYYQRWQFKKDMRMSKKEVKDEYKNQEGDPMMKSKRKQLHQELSMESAAQETRNADAVIVNPEHIAVAIRYDKETEGAPRVVSKGQRLWAEKIKEIAKEEGIPILRNVPLAAALNKLEVGEDIPEELYDAVAEILQFVYKLAEERGEVE